MRRKRSGVAGQGRSMQRPPAVVIVARHGLRLDAADPNWHHTTPTPYDPPLTYAGWNQSRALGVRIASLLHAREQAINNLTEEPAAPNSTTSRDLADGCEDIGSNGSRKRKRTHKVVIHSSPFLRCLQTSVGIAAGMAQFEPVSESGSAAAGSQDKKEGSLTKKPTPSIVLTPSAKPQDDEIFGHVTTSLPRWRHKSKLRVDAFLGEWLNPEYFDHITPPPPSNMMVAAAKAELMQNEELDSFTPSTSSKGNAGNLWGAPLARNKSRESLLDDWSEVRHALPATKGRRSRASSAASVNSADSSANRSPFRSGHVLQPLTSSLPKQQEQSGGFYAPPKPAYAVSGADQIPRGYLAHARNATVNIDYQWDSSRPPQDWGDGGELGEEWSSMHKRFRRGLSYLVQWYAEHDSDARAEDALGLEQADHDDVSEEDEDWEDLVVVMVTHGAGCNALIGALTGQPVLLDVSMASLTMAFKKEDAPMLPSPAPSGSHRGSGLDNSLSTVYDMQIVASTEHLRPRVDPSSLTGISNSTRAPSAGYSPLSGIGASAMPPWQVPVDIKRPSRNACLGSIRRPSAITVASNTSGSLQRTSTFPSSGTDHDGTQGTYERSPPLHLPDSSSRNSTGLWTPPAADLRTPSAARTPLLYTTKPADEKSSLFFSLEHTAPSSGQESPGHDMVLDFSNSLPNSRPTSSGGEQRKLVDIDYTVEGSSKKGLWGSARSITMVRECTTND